jgi:F0F1-type ATP synthase epsilon subunit
MSITLPASGGRTEILPHHAESFLLLASGMIVIQLSDGKSEAVEAKEGSCYVKEGKVVIVL